MCSVSRSGIHSWPRKNTPPKQSKVKKEYDISFKQICVIDPADMSDAYLPIFERLNQFRVLRWRIHSNIILPSPIRKMLPGSGMALAAVPPASPDVPVLG